MSTPKLVAYHNDPQIKSEILAELAQHRAADQLVQGYGYWKDGKGCAVGCTLHSGDHIEYEARFGIPVAIARLEDTIFESLSINAARAWPERLMTSIRPGQDLARVHWALFHWILTDETINPGINHPTVRSAVRQCADLMAVLKSGGEVSTWSAKRAAGRAVSAAGATWSTEIAARSAAWSAAGAARSAEESAAGSIESVLRSAAGMAWSAEFHAAWLKISDKLIELIEAAPMVENV